MRMFQRFAAFALCILALCCALETLEKDMLGSPPPCQPQLKAEELSDKGPFSPPSWLVLLAVALTSHPSPDFLWGADAAVRAVGRTQGGRHMALSACPALSAALPWLTFG